MPAYQDRIKETSTTTGTGNFTLAGAVTGFRSFNSVYSNPSESFPYVIDDLAGNWEVGLGMLSGAATLVRQVIYESSNSNALVNFPAGTKFVFVTLPAKEAVSIAHAMAYSGGSFIQG